MHILITGGTGFIGKQLSAKLLQKKFQLTLLSRRPAETQKLFATQFPNSTINIITHLKEIPSHHTIDAIINLSGENIASKRWSSHRKKQLLTSRIGVTEELVQWLKHKVNRPKVFISGSAIGFYGNNLNNQLTERDIGQPGFTHSLCHRWECTALKAKSLGIRVVLLRLGLVLGNSGGIMKKLLPSFHLGLGAIVGSGNQWLSWVHIQDVIQSILFILDTDEMNGAINITAPESVTYATFAKTLGQVVHRPVFLPIPKPALKLILGEQSQLILDSIRCIPEKLHKRNFNFEFPKLKSALNEIVKGV